jgi:hypothetical protein
MSRDCLCLCEFLCLSAENGPKGVSAFDEVPDTIHLSRRKAFRVFAMPRLIGTVNRNLNGGGSNADRSRRASKRWRPRPPAPALVCCATPVFVDIDPDTYKAFNEELLRT